MRDDKILSFFLFLFFFVIVIVICAKRIAIFHTTVRLINDQYAIENLWK